MKAGKLRCDRVVDGDVVAKSIFRTVFFNEFYPYFSSISKSFLEHSKKYVDYIIDRFKINNNSRVYELASNDGYLLQYFQKKNFNCIYGNWWK